MCTSGDPVEDRLRRHALPLSAGQVGLVTSHHLPQNNSETVHITAGSVTGAWVGRGKIRESGWERGRERERKEERERTTEMKGGGREGGDGREKTVEL